MSMRTTLTKKIEFINHGGTHTMADGTVIPKGGRFMADPDSIPKAFQDVIRPVDKSAFRENAVTPVSIVYTSRERATPGVFDIIDPNNKVVSEKGLTEAEANEVLERLNT